MNVSTNNIPETKTPDDRRYGSLLGPDIKIQRKWFNEMLKLWGIQVKYYEPEDDKHFDLHGDLRSNYKDPIVVGCIFDQYPNQQSMKKRGWITELQEGASIIYVPYDLPGIQQGALFAIPSGLDNSKDRFFRVNMLSNIIVYPASITCEIVPEHIDELPQVRLNTEMGDFNLIKTHDDSVW